MKQQSILLLFLLLCLASVNGCDEGPPGSRPTKVYVPDGYVGWVKVEYNVPSAPSLPKDVLGAWQYQRIPETGLLRTSDQISSRGSATREYYYRSEGSDRPIPRDFVHPGIISFLIDGGGGNSIKEQFLIEFIGPTDVYEKHRAELKLRQVDTYWFVPEDQNYLPTIGDISRR
jgi:hypothetical protein